jgi:hypothetical protein
MDELGIHAYRADHSQQIGRITEQMFNSILEDDLCVAILTFCNPNVFYELAIAQCAARPVIILIEKGQTIPFDVHDLRAVEYDLRPRPLRDKVYVKQIVELVRGLELVQWSVHVPFGKDLSPLASPCCISASRSSNRAADFLAPGFRARHSHVRTRVCYD